VSGAERAVERIQEKRRRQSNTYRSPRADIPPYGKGWHDGYVTALAEVSLIISEETDPEGWAEHLADQQALGGTDREWFERTGCCGHCGNPAEDCLCTDDDPCQCGPHPERRTWPRDCGWCKGTGKVEPVLRASTSGDGGRAGAEPASDRRDEDAS
jgi:hypothetical protein